MICDLRKKKGKAKVNVGLVALIASIRDIWVKHYRETGYLGKKPDFGYLEKRFGDIEHKNVLFWNNKISSSINMYLFLSNIIWHIDPQNLLARLFFYSCNNEKHFTSNDVISSKRQELTGYGIFRPKINGTRDTQRPPPLPGKAERTTFTLGITRNNVWIKHFSNSGSKQGFAPFLETKTFKKIENTIVCPKIQECRATSIMQSFERFGFHNKNNFHHRKRFQQFLTQKDPREIASESSVSAKYEGEGGGGEVIYSSSSPRLACFALASSSVKIPFPRSTIEDRHEKQKGLWSVYFHRSLLRAFKI